MRAMIGAQASTQAAHAPQSTQSASRLASYATTSVERSKRTPWSFAYGQAVAQKRARRNARSRKRTTASTAHEPPAQPPSVPAASRRRNSPGATKYQTRSAATTAETAAVIAKPSGRRQGRCRLRGSGSRSRVRSPSTVCGQAQPHQTRPHSSVTRRNAAVTRSVAARTTNASSIAKDAPKAWSRPAGTSSRSALSPPIVTNGSPSATAAWAAAAILRHLANVPVVILEHLVLRPLDAVLPAAPVVEDRDDREQDAE